MTFGRGVGDSRVTYVRFDPPRSWAAESTSPRLDVGAEGEVAPTGSGSRVVVRTEVRPHGPLRLLAPVLRRYVHSAWNRNLAVIKAQLENRDWKGGDPHAGRHPYHCPDPHAARSS
jgi:hypothetical protein